MFLGPLNYFSIAMLSSLADTSQDKDFLAFLDSLINSINRVLRYFTKNRWIL